MIMGTIRVFLVSSIDGSYLPLDLQRFHGFDVSEYEKLYRDADIILVSSVRYAKLLHGESNQNKQIYEVTKEMSLIPYNDVGINGLTTIDQLKKVGEKNVIILGNDNKLNHYLFEKDWVDEMIVCTFPVVYQRGRRFFPAALPDKSWNVNGHQLFNNGIMITFYKREAAFSDK